MDIVVGSESIKKITLQRNIIASIGTVSLLTNFLLSIFVFTKDQKTILVPPIIGQELVVGNHTVSTVYLEEMTNFFLGLLLNLTNDNFHYNKALILRYVDPKNHSKIQRFLDKQQEHYKKVNASTFFSITAPLEVKDSNLDRIEVKARGILNMRFGKDGYKESIEEYRLLYAYNSGKLSILEFGRIGDDQEEIKND